jgi:hypothetical protein
MAYVGNLHTKKQLQQILEGDERGFFLLPPEVAFCFVGGVPEVSKHFLLFHNKK